MNENRGKMIDKIKKVLELARNNPSKEESISATLKAQKLMSEYNISQEEVEDRTEITEEIIEASTFIGKGNKWKYRISVIIAKNFRCKSYFVGNETIVFYGFESDAKIALEVFKFVFETGNKMGRKYVREYKKAHGYADGVFNAYIAGFVEGFRESLEKQCTALMIVTPKEVEESYKQKISNFDFKTVSSSLRVANDGKIREDGKSDGRQVANGRQLVTN